MGKIARMKILVTAISILVILVYLVYNSEWFQKKVLYPFPYQEMVYEYALENDLNPFFVAGVIRTESKFVATARSPKGAQGLMQMMPETAVWVAEQMEDREFTLDKLKEFRVSIKMGTWYLASLRKEFKGNEVLMLAAYNGGRGNVKQWMQNYGWTMSFDNPEEIPFGETREYVTRVLRSKQRYQELYGR